MLRTSQNTIHKKEIVVLGGGVAGVAAALELAEQGWKVILIEKKTLFSGATGSNPGRMGLGFHYADFDTARTYLRASIKVQRRYPHYLVAKDTPYGRGRYFITKDSKIPKEELLETYEKLRLEYQALIDEDPLNEVFGSPELFFRVLDPSEYINDINPDKVDVAIETAEHLFDITRFAEDLRAKVKSTSNIDLYEHTEVCSVQRGAYNQDRFIIRCNYFSSTTGTSSDLFFHANYVVNSTWENIDLINSHIDLHMIPESRTHRLKCILVVKLPDSLKKVASSFFCMGSFCMFSNLNNGYGMITYADNTNIECSHGVELEEKSKRYLRGQISSEEKDSLSNAILRGASEYIPEMIHAEIVDLKFGIIRTNGKAELATLHEKKSSIAKRDYNGVVSEQQGWVSNPAIKLFYFIDNGFIVADIFQKQYNVEFELSEYFKFTFSCEEEFELRFSNDLKRSLVHIAQLYAPAEMVDVKLFLAFLTKAIIDKSKLNKSINYLSHIRSNKDFKRNAFDECSLKSCDDQTSYADDCDTEEDEMVSFSHGRISEVTFQSDTDTDTAPGGYESGYSSDATSSWLSSTPPQASFLHGALSSQKAVKRPQNPLRHYFFKGDARSSQGLEEGVEEFNLFPEPETTPATGP